MLIRVEQTILRAGDDHHRHLDLAVTSTQDLQTRAQSSLVISGRLDLLGPNPHLRRLLGILVLHVLRIVSLPQTLPYNRAPDKRCQHIHGKLSNQRDVRNKRHHSTGTLGYAAGASKTIPEISFPYAIAAASTSDLPHERPTNTACSIASMCRASRIPRAWISTVV